jgi:hypothetical protein
LIDWDAVGKAVFFRVNPRTAKMIAVMGCLALSASALYFPFTLTRDSELGTRPHNLHDDAVYTGDNVEFFCTCLSVCHLSLGQQEKKSTVDATSTSGTESREKTVGARPLLRVTQGPSCGGVRSECESARMTCGPLM